MRSLRHTEGHRNGRFQRSVARPSRPRFHLVAAHNGGIVMRDIFTEIYRTQPLDPMESARQGARVTLRKRFYERAAVGEAAGEGGGYPILLDGKPVRTPA